MGPLRTARQRQCLSREYSRETRGKGSVAPPSAWSDPRMAVSARPHTTFESASKGISLWQNGNSTARKGTPSRTRARPTGPISSCARHRPATARPAPKPSRPAWLARHGGVESPRFGREGKRAYEYSGRHLERPAPRGPSLIPGANWARLPSQRAQQVERAVENTHPVHAVDRGGPRPRACKAAKGVSEGNGKGSERSRMKGSAHAGWADAPSPPAGPAGSSLPSCCGRRRIWTSIYAAQKTAQRPPAGLAAANLLQNLLRAKFFRPKIEKGPSREHLHTHLHLLLFFYNKKVLCSIIY